MKSIITTFVLCCQFLSANGITNGYLPQNIKRSKSLGDIRLLSDMIGELKKQTVESVSALKSKGIYGGSYPDEDMVIENLEDVIAEQKEELTRLICSKLKKYSYHRTEYEKHTEKLIHLLSLDQKGKPVEVRFVNAENIIRSFQLPEWKENMFLDLLHSKKSLKDIFKESCLCPDKRLERELLDIIDNESNRSQIFRDVMICLFAISQSNLLPKNAKKIAFEKIKGIESFCAVNEDGIIQLGNAEEIYIRSVFKGMYGFSLESSNIFGIRLPKKFVLFHESGHGISPFFNELPINEEIMPYENHNLKLQEVMNPQSKSNYNIVHKISPTEIDNKNFDDVLSGIISEKKDNVPTQDNKHLFTQLLKEIIDLFTYGNKEYSVTRNENGEITNEKIVKKNYFGEVTYEETTNYKITRKERKHVEIDFSEPYSPSFRQGIEHEYCKGKVKKTIQRKTYLNENNEITKEKIIEKDETGKVTWEGIIEYKKTETSKSIKVDSDTLKNSINLGKSILKKYASSPEIRSELTFSGISEVWQILGLSCVENKDKSILYVNELSDFALYSSIGFPIRFDHCGGANTDNSALFYPSYIKVGNINWELYDTLFKLHGSNLNEYLGKLTNGKSTTLEQYAFNLLYPYGLSSLLKNEYRLMRYMKIEKTW